MKREKLEKLSTLFLAVFSAGLALPLISIGMDPRQWPGAAVAIIGSLGLALGVRIWPSTEARAARDGGARVR